MINKQSVKIVFIVCMQGQGASYEMHISKTNILKLFNVISTTECIVSSISLIQK